MTSSHTRNGNLIPGRDELVGRADALQPLLREYAAKTDAERCLPDAVNAALDRGGFLPPSDSAALRWLRNQSADCHEVAETLGAGDASAAWLVALAAAAGSLVGRASVQAQQELFGSDPDARVAGGCDPVVAVRVDGGVRMTGRWPYASGARFRDVGFDFRSGDR